jgi:hypothetical protein
VFPNGSSQTNKMNEMNETGVVSYLVYYHPDATSGERLVCGLLFRVGIKWHLMLNKDPTRYLYGFGNTCSAEAYMADIHNFVQRFLNTPITSIASIRAILPLHMSIRFYAYDTTHNVSEYMNEMFRFMVLRDLASPIPHQGDGL